MDGRGYFFIRPTPTWKNNLVVESPHSKSELTGSTTVEVFTDTLARSFMLAGTHRCANMKVSRCSGRTAVCKAYSYGGRRSKNSRSHRFKISDMAHSDKTFFQVNIYLCEKKN